MSALATPRGLRPLCRCRVGVRVRIRVKARVTVGVGVGSKAQVKVRLHTWVRAAAIVGSRWDGGVEVGMVVGMARVEVRRWRYGGCSLAGWDWGEKG